MKEMFGIPMDTIMLVLVTLFAVSLGSVLLILFTSGHMFRMGLRNVPRRGLQTGLVVIGLMLATLITTAAFTTGDTVDHSISRSGYDRLQRTDLTLNPFGEDTVADSDAAVYFNESAVAALETRFAGDPDIDGFIPLLLERVPATNQRSGQSEPSIVLSGIDPARLARLGGLRLAGGGQADLARLGANDILLSERGADKLAARAGDTLTLFANGQAVNVTVAAIVKDELAASGNVAFYEKGTGGGAMLLSSVQRFTAHEGEINHLGVALKGGVATSYLRSDAAVSRLQPVLQSEEGSRLLGVTNPVSIDTIKQDSIEEAESTGNLFTTFFLVLGLFSVAAGVMLIFMIFVMLATERKPEMGMARAVGAQRSALVQSFIAEGMAYSLLAGAIGALVGVAAAVGLVVVFLRVSGGFDFIQAHVTLRSLVISYCLGVVITFLTVVFSSLKVSSVNIVAAIRGTDEEGARERKRRISWFWVVAGLPALIVPPLGLWLLLRKGLGISWAWILAPAGIVLGVGTILLGSSAELEAPFSFGVSILPLSFAALAAHYRAPGRLTWTLVGAYLALYWLAPIDYSKTITGKELDADIEMFLLSGVMVVISFTLIIVFNARLLTSLFERDNGSRYNATIALAALALAAVAGGALLGDYGDGVGQLLFLLGGILAIGAAVALAAVVFPHLAPALKMGVAYPLSNRFRTGMTIAMFSLIVFSLSAFSAVNASFVAMLTADGGDGGWDVLTTSNRTSNVDDLGVSLRGEGAPVAQEISSIGRSTTFNGTSQVGTPGGSFRAFPVLAADDAFLTMPEGKLQAWAEGYADERAVFEAVRRGANLALVDPSVLPDGFNNYDFQVAGLEVEDDRFQPFELEYRDTVTQQSGRVTVVGILAIQVDSKYTAGVYLPERQYRATFGEPQYLRGYVKLQDGVNSRRAAEAIEATLATQGVQAESIRQLLDDSVAQNNSFIRMFQGFMGLGLVTGMAALGVIAFRSVVERRQQIGMLRAIGYQTGTVALTFMLESGFIALMGILSGVVGGIVIARNLFSSGEMSAGRIDFSIPWNEVLLIAVAAFAVSMLMTWWPSRQAARVPVAEALRYE